MHACMYVCLLIYLLIYLFIRNLSSESVLKVDTEKIPEIWTIIRIVCLIYFVNL